MNEPLVAVLVLNWNGKEFTLACLESLQHLSYSNTKLIGVNNHDTRYDPEYKANLKRQIIENKLRTQRLTLTAEVQQNMTLDIEQLRTRRKRVEEDSYNDYKRLEFTLNSRIRKEVW